MAVSDRRQNFLLVAGDGRLVHFLNATGDTKNSMIQQRTFSLVAGDRILSDRHVEFLKCDRRHKKLNDTTENFFVSGRGQDPK